MYVCETAGAHSGAAKGSSLLGCYTPCGWVSAYRRLGWLCRIHFQGLVTWLPLEKKLTCWPLSQGHCVASQKTLWNDSCTSFMCVRVCVRACGCARAEVLICRKNIEKRVHCSSPFRSSQYFKHECLFVSAGFCNECTKGAQTAYWPLPIEATWSMFVWPRCWVGEQGAEGSTGA